MRAVRLSAPGPVGNLRLTTGWVRIRVQAFGLNRSELPREALQGILDAVAAGRLAFPTGGLGVRARVRSSRTSPTSNESGERNTRALRRLKSVIQDALICLCPAV